MAEKIEYEIQDSKDKCCQHWIGVAKNNPCGFAQGVKCQGCGIWHPAELRVKEVLAA